MNRRLRTRHRLMIGVVASIVPAIFLAGLMSRPANPTTDHSLPEDRESLAAYTQIVAEYTGIAIGDAVVTIRVLDGPKRMARPVVEFEPNPGVAIVGADLLAYWSETRSAENSLPGDAVLIGPLGGDRPRRYLLPAIAAGTAGHLYVYSEAMKTLIAEPVAINARN